MLSTFNGVVIIMFFFLKLSYISFDQTILCMSFLLPIGNNEYLVIMDVHISYYILFQVTSTSLLLDVDSQHVTEGDTVTLTCIADEANPTSHIMWYKNGVGITEGVVNVIVGGHYNSDRRISVLTLTASRQHNDVSYSCEVEGTDLEANHIMNVECKWNDA